MSRPPRFAPAADLAYDEAVVDPTPARSSILLDVDARQHAAISGYGGAPWCQSLDLAATGATVTGYGYLRTCGVGVARLGVLVTGRGSVTVSSALDANGTTFWWYDIGAPEWRWTTEQYWAFTFGADALYVDTSPDLTTWTDTRATLTLAAPVGSSANVLALAVLPMHRPL